jgi:hypothetical protein
MNGHAPHRSIAAGTPSRPASARIAFALWTGFAFVTGVCGGLVAEPRAWFAVAGFLAVYRAACLWLVGDSRRASRIGHIIPHP